MRIRHEVLIDDVALDATANEVVSVPGLNGNISTELISISNFDEETQEDIPSLLIRQEKDIEIDLSLAYVYANVGSGRRISADYTTPEWQVPASGIRRTISWSAASRAFKVENPEWVPLIERVDRDFALVASTLYNTLRWWSGYLGGTDETANRILLADLGVDGWSVLFSSKDDWTLYFWDIGPMSLGLDVKSSLPHLVTRGCQEPLARGILREASQHRISSPRVALIMAVAAAEAAVKSFIAARIPSWSQPVVVEAQQLPLHKLLGTVIPDFVKQNTDIASPELPKKTVTNPIRDAVEFRNVAIHQPPDSPKYLELSSALDYKGVIGLLGAVSDLLYFLDYFSGEAWALERVSKQSKEEWVKRNPIN
jgi:hypothetical protein